MTVDTVENRVSDYLSNLPTPNCSARKPVKRSLFGKVDHDESIKFLKQQMDDLNEKAKKKWNFDFQAEKPLKGKYEWVCVQFDNLPVKPPAPVYSTVQSCSSGPCEIATDNQPNSSSPLQSDEVTVPARKLMQKKIDDFMKPRKSVSNNHVESDKNQQHRNTNNLDGHRPPLTEPSPKKIRSS